LLIREEAKGKKKDSEVGSRPKGTGRFIILVMSTRPKKKAKRRAAKHKSSDWQAGNSMSEQGSRYGKIKGERGKDSMGSAGIEKAKEGAAGVEGKMVKEVIIRNYEGGLGEGTPQSTRCKRKADIKITTL